MPKSLAGLYAYTIQGFLHAQALSSGIYLPAEKLLINLADVKDYDPKLRLIDQSHRGGC